MNAISVNSDFVDILFHSIKRTKIIKLKKIMKLYNMIDDNFRSNIPRNFHKNMKNKWVIAIMNTNMRSLIFNSSIMLNNINKNIRKAWIEIILKKKLSMFRYKSREYFVIEWRLEDREVERCIWSTFWDLHEREKMH